MKFVIKEGSKSDVDAMIALLPRLAEFNHPAHRSSEELWHGDRELIQSWASGSRNDVVVLTALIEEKIVGLAVSSLREEMLNHEPSSHLEILAVTLDAEGQGVASALLRENETAVSDRGARSMSLHVFAANTRARKLYESMGFDGEIMRYFKQL